MPILVNHVNPVKLTFGPRHEQLFLQDDRISRIYMMVLTNLTEYRPDLLRQDPQDDRVTCLQEKMISGQHPGVKSPRGMDLP
jgi:hypothetical protein